MALLLNIDTSTGQASVCVADNGKALSFLSNPVQMDHASWLHTAIRQVLQESGLQLAQMEAVAVTAGPGSYTGLRVGLATAKGLCYALNLPLITLNTLEVMAFAALEKHAEITLSLAGKSDAGIDKAAEIVTGFPESLITGNTEAAGVQDPDSPVIAPPLLICPMIDARRMEVFTALYDAALNELAAPCAMILEDGSFKEYLEKGKIIFFGNGSDKWQKIQPHPNAVFENISFSAANLAVLAEKRFKAGNFSPLAYSEPVYIKEFYTPLQGSRLNGNVN